LPDSPESAVQDSNAIIAIKLTVNTAIDDTFTRHLVSFFPPSSKTSRCLLFGDTVTLVQD
jgi:hypothetical protein